jgi:hypothetical protein
MTYNLSHWFRTHSLHVKYIWCLTTALRGFSNLDVGYRTKVYSDIQYNVGLGALQSDIGRSDNRLSPISLITDSGLSAHL